MDGRAELRCWGRGTAEGLLRREVDRGGSPVAGNHSETLPTAATMGAQGLDKDESSMPSRKGIFQVTAFRAPRPA